MYWPDARAGARSALPVLPALIPFGLLAGAVPVAAGFSPAQAMAASVLMYAGTA